MPIWPEETLEDSLTCGLSVKVISKIHRNHPINRTIPLCEIPKTRRYLSYYVSLSRSKSRICLYMQLYVTVLLCGMGSTRIRSIAKAEA